MVPVELQPYNTFIVCVSGGRDSTALWLWALEHLPHDKLVIAHNPTGASWPHSKDYLSYLAGTLGEIVHVKSGDHPLPSRHDHKPRQSFTAASNLYDMISLRGKWPSFWQRYCTRYLKEWPIRLYAREIPNSILLFGERRQESKRRASLPFFGDLFKGKKAYRHPVYRPILDWSGGDVNAMLSRHSISPNPIYTYTDRCGCWCCPLARKGQIATFCKMYPSLARRWADLEIEINHTWRQNYSVGDALSETLDG